jgi:hypothetical protein
MMSRTDMPVVVEEQESASFAPYRMGSMTDLGSAVNWEDESHVSLGDVSREKTPAFEQRTTRPGSVKVLE